MPDTPVEWIYKIFGNEHSISTAWLFGFRRILRQAARIFWSSSGGRLPPPHGVFVNRKNRWLLYRGSGPSAQWIPRVMMLTAGRWMLAASLLPPSLFAYPAAGMGKVPSGPNTLLNVIWSVAKGPRSGTTRVKNITHIDSRQRAVSVPTLRRNVSPWQWLVSLFLPLFCPCALCCCVSGSVSISFVNVYASSFSVSIYLWFFPSLIFFIFHLLSEGNKISGSPSIKENMFSEKYFEVRLGNMLIHLHQPCIHCWAHCLISVTLRSLTDFNRYASARAVSSLHVLTLFHVYTFK